MEQITLEDFIKNYKNNQEHDANLSIKSTEWFDESIKNYLFYGDVQSGKTTKTFNLILSLIKKFDVIVYFDGTNNSLHEQTSKRWCDFRKKINNFVNKNFFSNIDPSYFGWDENCVNNENKYFFLITKKIGDYYAINEIIKKPFFKNKRLLIIDDESDYGSSEITNGEFYKQMENLYKTCDNCWYFAITATPFKNLKSNGTFKIEKFILFTDLYGENKDYTGIETFFSNDSYKVINSINYEDFIDLWIEKSEEFIKLPGNKDKSIEFLINVTYKVDGKQKMEEITQQIEKIVSKKKLNNSQISVWRFFSDYKYCSSNDENTDDSKYRIIVSGIKASRGYTFNNLLFALVTNVSDNTNISTILQMCRWFGYRHDSIKYMTIFVNAAFMSKLKDALNFINFIKLNKNNLCLLKNKNYDEN